jgi:hypothetical protein
MAQTKSTSSKKAPNARIGDATRQQPTAETAGRKVLRQSAKSELTKTEIRRAVAAALAEAS